MYSPRDVVSSGSVVGNGALRLSRVVVHGYGGTGVGRGGRSEEFCWVVRCVRLTALRACAGMGNRVQNLETPGMRVLLCSVTA